jgi:alkylresorcinol/alkylpyrone synthase
MLSLATASPPHLLTQAEAADVARDILAGSFADFDRMLPVFQTAGVHERQLVRPADWYRQPRSFPERNEVYLQAAGDLFVAAATRALGQAGIDGSVVDTVVTVSSTGIATPSLEARAMTRMGFRSDMMRVPVFGLGCAGGVAGLGIAARLAAARPGSTVLLVVVEACSLAFRSRDVGKADLISTALFGDGAAACVLQSGDHGFATITGVAEKTWADTLDIMGWRLEEDGFGVILNRGIPAFARAEMRGAIDQMLAAQGLETGDIDRFICHPGGAKVIDALEQALDLNQGDLLEEREVLGRHGNMSAPTALFVLDAVRRQKLPARSVLTALGPGFTASTVTLRAAA